MSLAVKHWQGDAALGVVFALIGAGLIAVSSGYAPGEDGVPGAGFLPTLLGCGLIAAGLGSALRAWRAGAGAVVELGERRALIVVAALTLAILAWVPLGFIGTAAVFLTALFQLLGRIGWVRAIASGVGTAAVVWAVFDYALGVQLPAGWLGI